MLSYVIFLYLILFWASIGILFFLDGQTLYGVLWFGGTLGWPAAWKVSKHLREKRETAAGARSRHNFNVVENKLYLSGDIGQPDIAIEGYLQGRRTAVLMLERQPGVFELTERRLRADDRDRIFSELKYYALDGTWDEQRIARAVQSWQADAELTRLAEAALLNSADILKALSGMKDAERDALDALIKRLRETRPEDRGVAAILQFARPAFCRTS